MTELEEGKIDHCVNSRALMRNFHLDNVSINSGWDHVLMEGSGGTGNIRRGFNNVFLSFRSAFSTPPLPKSIPLV